jgi:hypothetical protein
MDMKLEEMIIHTKRNAAYKKHVTELNKELADRKKILKAKLSQKKKQKVTALGSYENAAETLLQNKSNPEIDLQAGTFMDDVAEFVNFASKKIDRYFKSTVNINVSKEMIPQLAGAMLGSMVLQTSKAYILMVKDMIRKGLIEKVPLQIVAALEAVEKDPKAFFEKGIYPKLPLKQIEKFILEFSKTPTFKPMIQEINRSLKRLNDLIVKNKYMSRVKDRNPIAL